MNRLQPRGWKILSRLEEMGVWFEGGTWRNGLGNVGFQWFVGQDQWSLGNERKRASPGKWSWSEHSTKPLLSAHVHPRSQHPRDGEILCSYMELQGSQVGDLTSHMRWKEGPCLLLLRRDPALTQGVAHLLPNPNVSWMSESSGFQEGHAHRPKALRRDGHDIWTNIFQEPTPLQGVEIQQDMFHVMWKLISQPSSNFIWYTCTQLLSSYWFLGINVAFLRFLNPLERPWP